jgi:CubicO group peptidase (beta-lactamase class C family)
MNIPNLQWHRLARGLVALSCAIAASACGGSSGAEDAPGAISDVQLRAAIDQLDATVADMMQRTGVPGLAVAVVRGDEVVYAKGFGVRALGSPQRVDADTVFMLGSISKPIGATVVARQVSEGRIAWDTPMQRHLPWFTLADPYVGASVTIGDLYAHRSGLPDHAGDLLEEVGYPREETLRRLARMPLAPFRDSFLYTNYGVTGAATAVAAAAGSDWATLSEQSIYRPLGMVSTSSRFADFQARPNRALGHVKENGSFVLGAERRSAGQQRWSAYNTDEASPSGGVSSSANDMGRWMSFVIGVATGSGASPGRALVQPSALLPAITPRNTSYQARSPGEQSVYYGYGFNVKTNEAGRVVLSHNGALSPGASTNFAVLPAARIGIVVLTNSWPVGLPESLTEHFTDVLQYGQARKDWLSVFSEAYGAAFTPQGTLAGQPRPAQPAPAQALEAYVGAYGNGFYGTVQVARHSQGGLELRMGPQLQLAYGLSHWDGDAFTFVPTNDNAPPGSVSKADFTAGRLVLEHYNEQGLGVFTRQPAP